MGGRYEIGKLGVHMKKVLNVCAPVSKKNALLCKM